MFGIIWNTLLINPILNLLIGFYHLTGSLGWALIIMTILTRAIVLPLVLPSIKTMKKQRDLQPQLEEIKKKYKYDKQKQTEMQMALFKEHGINPASGCLSQIAMIVILIALYNVINRFAIHADINTINSLLYFDFLKLTPGSTLNVNFGYMNLTKADPYFVLATLAGLFQLIAAKMMMPYIKEAEKDAEKTEGKADDIAFQMQQQSLYMMPIMNFIISVKLPAGVALYIVVTTLFSVFQTYFTSGLGGLKSWLKKIKSAKLAAWLEKL
jgi:YidC/Oxa1 family membrane protein insertase